MGKRGFISANNALFVSVDLIGEKNQIILEFHINCKIATRGATVTGCAPVLIFCFKGLYKYNIQSLKATKNTERLKFQDFNICPNILHVDADAGG